MGAAAGASSGEMWLRRPLVLLAIGLVLRLVCFPFFGSGVTHELFLPFLRSGVEDLWSNPWSDQPASAFPYGATLYVVHLLPFVFAKFLFGDLVLTSDALALSLLKAPMLGLDLMLLALLLRWHSQEKLKIMLLYWLNPLVIYVSYGHAQLDIATSALTFLSVLLFVSDRSALSAVALGLAVTCKFHAILLLPFLMAAIWNREFPSVAFRKISQYLAFFLPICVAGFLPLVVAGTGGYGTLGSPEAQRVLGATIELGGGSVIYIGLGVLAFFLARLCVSSRISENGVIYGSGALLLLLLLIADPAPGWFLWVTPFVASFFVAYPFASTLLVVANVLLYFLHFEGVPVSAGLLAGSPLLDALPIEGIVFTLLQVSTFSLLLFMWVLGARNSLPLRARLRPFAFAIAGDSGAGKNRLSSGLEKLIGAGQTRMVEGDDYHKWERGHERWQMYTHLSPRANHLDTLAEHTHHLLGGRTIFQPHYDHSTGRFTPPRRALPAKALIIQGLHTLYLRRMRDVFDLKIFLNPHYDVRLSWKIRRDVVERGHTVEKVVTSLDKRMSDSKVFIDPQRSVADWVIEAFPLKQLSREEILEGATLPVGMRHCFWNDVPVSDLVEVLRTGKNLKVELKAEAQDQERVVLEISGEVTQAEICHMAELLFPHPRQITRGRTPPQWQPGTDGINQLIAMTLVRYKTGDAAV